MPLPDVNTPWPPKALGPALEQIRAWSAWWAGDPAELARVYERYTYGNVRPSERPSQYRGGIVGAIARFFWGAPVPTGERRTKLHVPIASDMASTSADLLFSEPVLIKAAQESDAATQERLDELVRRTHPTLLESAEVCAGLGGVYLHQAWDRDVDPDGPWWTARHADAAVPEWRYGRLWAVTFWRVVGEDGHKVVRHLERHARGVIEHGVFEGNAENLGRAVDLGAFEQTQGLESIVETGVPLLTASYVPNIRPNRIWRNDPVACHLGRSDYLGCEPLMDALDEVYSALMRDVRLGKARAMVPSFMLQSAGPGQGAVFDADREYFTEVNAPPNTNPASGLPITTSQPEIRHEAYLRIALDFIARIVGTAGYSGQTFGIAAEGDGAATATETAARTRKSLITRDKKGLYWLPELEHQAQVTCLLGNAHFRWGVSGERPKATLPDAVQPTQRELAETAEKLKLAEAASIETRVRLVNNGWAEEQIAAEVQRIKDELGVTVPAADGFGGGDEDEPGDMPTGDEMRDMIDRMPAGAR